MKTAIIRALMLSWNWLFILSMPIWGGIFLVVLLFMDAWNGRNQVRDVFAGKLNVFYFG